jgi:hypothetical protein
MAVAQATITCRQCGRQFEWRKKCYNRKDANREEEWAKGNISQCPDCWHKEQAAIKKKEEKERSEAFAIELEKYQLPPLTGTEKQVEWATIIRNNSVGKAVKQEPTELFWVMVRLQTEAKWWIDHRNKTADLYGLVLLLNAAYEKQEEEKRITEKIREIKKPSVPDVLKEHRWNHKIYGKAGNYCIYPDGEKIMITDGQAEEIKEYLAAEEDYRKKVDEIKCQS